MKNEEKQMRQYLRQIRKQLEVTETLRERILSDLENDILAGLEQGETMDEIRSRMGTPEEIGKRFSEELQAVPKSSWIWLPRMGLLLSAVALVFFVLWNLPDGSIMSGTYEGSVAIVGGTNGPESFFVTGRIGGIWTGLWNAILLLLAIFLACWAVCLAAGRKRRNAAALILSILAVAAALGGSISGCIGSDGTDWHLADGMLNFWRWAGTAATLLVAFGTLLFMILRMVHSRKK